jgi:hypothetical protein
MSRSKPIPQSHSDTLCLGQLLLYGGFIDAEVLQQALIAQRRSRKGLGDLLERRRALTSVEKKAVLALQKKLRSQPLQFKADGSLPDTLQLCLGQLLLEHGAVSREQLNQALAEHRRQHRKLGEVLVEQQALTPGKLSYWLHLQKKLVAAASVAIILGSGCGSAAADEDEVSVWDKFKQIKVFRFGGQQRDNASWGQSEVGDLPPIDMGPRSYGELGRSRDGKVVVSVGQKGLEVTKRF